MYIHMHIHILYTYTYTALHCMTSHQTTSHTIHSFFCIYIHMYIHICIHMYPIYIYMIICISTYIYNYMIFHRAIFVTHPLFFSLLGSAKALPQSRSRKPPKKSSGEQQRKRPCRQQLSKHRLGQRW